MISTVALIVAAGRAERFGGGVPKQYLPLAGRPVLRHSIETFLAHPAVDAVRAGVLPHAPARPLVDAPLTGRPLAALDRVAGAVAAVPVTDTLKRAAGDGNTVTATVERAGLWRGGGPPRRRPLPRRRRRRRSGRTRGGAGGGERRQSQGDDGSRPRTRAPAAARRRRR